MPDPITLTDAAEGRTLGPVPVAPPPPPQMQHGNLSVLAYAHGFTSWHYRQDGALRDVMAPRFFERAADLLTSGDLITVSALDGMAQIAIRKVEHRVTATLMSSGFFPAGGSVMETTYLLCWTRRRAWLVGPFVNMSRAAMWACIGSERNPNDDPRWQQIEPDDETLRMFTGQIYAPSDTAGFLHGTRWENE